MNWIGKEREKEIPNETKVKRAKIIIAIMAVVIAIIVFVPGKKKNVETTKTPVEDIMDRTLDSIIVDLGYSDYDIYHIGLIETVVVERECPEKDMLEALEMRISMISSLSTLHDKEKIKRLDEAFAEKEILQKAIEKFENELGKEITYFSRRIRFSTPDGRKYTFFQNVYPDSRTVTTQYFIEITNSSGNAALEIAKIDNEINNN